MNYFTYLFVINVVFQISWEGKILSIAGHTKDPSETVSGLSYFIWWFGDLFYVFIFVIMFRYFYASEGIWSTNLYLVKFEDLWEATGNIVTSDSILLLGVNFPVLNITKYAFFFTFPFKPMQNFFEKMSKSI